MVQQGKTMTWQKFPAFLVFGCMAVLIGSGCGQPWEDDPVPIQGEYRVTLNPQEVTLDLRDYDLSSGEPKPSLPRVNVSVRCIGNDLPANCSSNNPAWRLRGTDLENFFSESRLQSRQAPNTVLVIEYDLPGIVEWAKHAAEIWLNIVVMPARVPTPLTLTGQRRLDIRVLLPDSGNIRAQEKPGRARLRVVPDRHHFTPTGDLTQRYRFVLGNPGGQDITIIGATFSGINASLFSLFGNPSFPRVLKPATAMTIEVQCAKVPSEDIRKLHIAIMELTVTDGIVNWPVGIPLMAKRYY